ncbi:MAG: DtxR family transcriptional regulator [candidate division NC10 bacterium RIFCSPLOWO2_12_FULL_66_18]|nr:MAG: DtxR family transcriptional regulator [candidate division NC10 bacterium RIFCSPLOWO2_02_FULL_66_22]OGB99336.1 MAG: DtxR family transcriptional regulator [candidate division NC10 bacterium RIFCSPLOWO2_12_FULL_66_18]
MFSQAMQDYLKAIYKLQEQGGVVSTSALAEAMGVAAASATGMVKKFASLRLVRHHPYQGVVLSKAGEKMALEVIRHHRLLELYLAEALGYTWDKVHEEAERLEHVISEEFEEKIFEALGRPTRDPHGDPIPAKDGTLVVAEHDRLSDLEPGAMAVIRQVSDSDAEMLRYLGTRGLVPDAAVEVLDKAPFNGPLTVKTGETAHVLGREVASHIRVEARAADEA